MAAAAQKAGLSMADHRPTPHLLPLWFFCTSQTFQPGEICERGSEPVSGRESTMTCLKAWTANKGPACLPSHPPPRPRYLKARRSFPQSAWERCGGGGGGWQARRETHKHPNTGGGAWTARPARS